MLFLWSAAALPCARAQLPTTLKQTIAAPVVGVAISGSWMAVGAPYDDTGATDSGSVYVYDLASTTPAIPVFALHNPAQDAGDFFGYAVALSGSRLAVSALTSDVHATEGGAVYVYDLASATPTAPLLLTDPNPTAAGEYGRALAISGSRLIVGASYSGPVNEGVAYVYDLAGVSPATPVTTLTHVGGATGDQFGSAVAISGLRAVVGAPFADSGALNAGSAYAFDLGSVTPGMPTTIFVNPVPAADDQFGRAVAVSGMQVLVGAPSKKVGSIHPGAAYVYDLAGPSPTIPNLTLTPANPADGDSFGTALALASSTAVVGAPLRDAGVPDAGIAFVFNLASGTPTTPVATLQHAPPAFGESFGWSMALDGFTLAIGVGDSSVIADHGAIYLFGPASNDTDGDGLLDLWEYAHFGTLAGHAAQDDADGDGTRELLELAFNHDPLVPEAKAAPAPVVEGGFLTLTIAKRAGATYLGQSGNSPADAAFSAATTTVLTDTATTLKFRDNVPVASGGARFLRVKVTAAP